MPTYRDILRKQFAVAADVKVHDIYGASWDKSSSSILTRTDNAVGLVANVGIDDQVVQNDFDDTPLFGSIREVTDDFGNVFIRIPKVYINKTDGPGLWERKVSMTKRPGFYRPWCFWDFANNRELPYIDVGKYKATLSADGKLESKAGGYPLISRNIVQFRDYAKANNGGGLKGYQQLDVHVIDLLQVLFYVEFATLDSQSIMSGYTSGQYTSTHLATVSEDNTNRIIVANAYADLYRVGQAISVGTSQGGNQIFYGRTISAIEDYDAENKAIVFDGEPVNIAAGNYLYNTGWKNGFSSDIAASSGSIISNDGKYPCAYRGIESPFGDIWQFVDGVNITDNQAWICKDANQYVSNVFASPYEQPGYANANTNNYVLEMGFDPDYPFAEFPTVVGSSSDSGYKDYYYQAAGQRIARFGGNWLYGSIAGLSFWNLNDSSSSTGVSFGGRLLKKPL